jgi:hypothetical protein
VSEYRTVVVTTRAPSVKVSTSGGAVYLQNPAGVVVKVSDGAGGYVWPNGEPPTGSFASIIFRGPDDPLTAPGGRDNPNDFWFG